MSHLEILDEIPHRGRSEHRPDSPSGQSIRLWTVCIEPGLGARTAGGVLVAAGVTGLG